MICRELACPADSMCTPVGCASPDQVRACTGVSDDTACETVDFATGSCVQGVCLEVACGDGERIGPEVCDDTNQRSGDGCSADCRSNETCGNGYADTLVGEQCDVGPFGLSGDGCSSRCKLEVPIWQSAATPRPIARSGHALAADPVRGRVVLFGGEDDRDGILADTWELDGAAWRLRTPVRSPPPLNGHAMAYDARRRRVVLFGGSPQRVGAALAETWEWDGVEWEQMTLPAAPTARRDGAMAYDPQRGEVVLVGGRVGDDQVPPDTWSYDGTRWTLITDTQLPATYWSALAYDTVGGRLVYTNGVATYTLSATTWTQLPGPMPTVDSRPSLATASDGVVMGTGRFAYTLRGSTWSARQPMSSLPVSGMPLAGDGTRVVGFGGNDSSGCVPGACFPPLDLAVELAGPTWRPLAATPMAQGAAAVFDASGNVFTFGGYDGGPSAAVSTDQVRVWSDGAWSVVPGLTSPSVSGIASAVATPRGIVLVGGFGAQAETWILAEGVFTQVTGPAPPARIEPMLVYRQATDTVVMQGGYEGGVGPRDDTWELGPDGWVERVSAVKPPYRDGALYAYDRVRDRMMIFGGSARDTGISDANLWEWDGTEWMLRAESGGPSARAMALGGYDSLRGRFVVAGGRNESGSLRDSWEWNGEVWTRVDSPTVVPVLDDSAQPISGYDELNARILVIDMAGTHALAYTSALSPRDVCTDSDTDGDALVGCADPDCTLRCVTCGDGTCDPIEHRRLCPADCP